MPETSNNSAIAQNNGALRMKFQEFQHKLKPYFDLMKTNEITNQS
jgi:hypothetical protein